ncbi:hypothetical protein HCN44_000954 [Aphidius gifuensis]|uniref:Transcription factor 25 n=1 Tax=Aphidius gifuensis TaxID=684658 RepID=A0A834XPA8_APHGI|nr:transcription factor 25 [Aphidius gifuensis]KAF7988381.1 hypothetical protein HCN44_000954 [Aphidius gifuensis]
MSTRYLRKVYGNDLPVENHQDDDTSDNDVSITEKKTKNFNVFDLLNDDSDTEKQEENNEVNVPSVSHQESSEDETIKRKKKRKKKRKNDKQVQKVSSDIDDNDDEEIDEIERSVREVNRLLGEPVPCSSKTSSNDTSNISLKYKVLSVQHKYLNPQNELNRICGSKNNQSKQRGNNGRTNFRKTWLTSQSDWISTGKSGLSMSVDKSMTNSNDNIQYFIFNHSTSYQKIQKKFYTAVESQSPDNIVNILNTYPHHVDALLQLSDVCKLNEDLQMSAEFVERAVHCLECAFHPLFNLTNGNCRLNYKQQTNRALFIALFRYLMFIGGRACYRTSLELSKVLLSLDPDDDPTAIVLAIDLYALRSKEYNWFIEFFNAWNDERNLIQLPNIAYSIALCYFNINDIDKADELLQNALFMFPGVLTDLLDKCGVSTDTRLLGHDYFNSKAKSTTTPALEKIESLYVIRTFHLWKENNVLPWIEKNVHIVMDKIDNGDKYADFCCEKRMQRYQGQLPKNILRHIVLSDIKEITILQPGMQQNSTFFSYDPLPPSDSINIYQNLQTTATTTAAGAEPSSHSGLLQLFVSSLFSDLDGQLNINGLNIRHAEESDDAPDEFD